MCYAWGSIARSMRKTNWFSFSWNLVEKNLKKKKEKSAVKSIEVTVWRVKGGGEAHNTFRAMNKVKVNTSIRARCEDGDAQRESKGKS